MHLWKPTNYYYTTMSYAFISDRDGMGYTSKKDILYRHHVLQLLRSSIIDD